MTRDKEMLEDLLKEQTEQAKRITLLLKDKRTGQGPKESELDMKLKSMETVIEELHLQNNRLLKREEERVNKKTLRLLLKKINLYSKSYSVSPGGGESKRFTLIFFSVIGSQSYA